MPPPGNWGGITGGLFTFSEKDKHNCVCGYEGSMMHTYIQTHRKLGSRQETMTHDLKRDILSPSLVLLFYVELSGRIKPCTAFTGGNILEACGSDDNQTQK